MVLYATFRWNCFAPFEIKHTASDIHSLVELINSVEGSLESWWSTQDVIIEVLAHQLSVRQTFSVSAINPKLIKDFNNDSLKVKSDKRDSVKIARYAFDKWQNLKQYNVVDELRNQFPNHELPSNGLLHEAQDGYENNHHPLTKPILVHYHLTVLHAVTAARNGLILHLTYSACDQNCGGGNVSRMPLSTIIKTGANV